MVSIAFRVPSWGEPKSVLTINGQLIEDYIIKDDYLTINGE